MRLIEQYFDSRLVNKYNVTVQYYYDYNNDNVFDNQTA